MGIGTIVWRQRKRRTILLMGRESEREIYTFTFRITKRKRINGQWDDRLKAEEEKEHF